MSPAKTKKKPKIELLSLKYKPRSLDDVIGRDEIIKTLRGFKEQKCLPNCLFEGLQGSGKTLIADLFIDDYIEHRPRRGIVKVVDASKDNDVKNIRDNIVSFMKTVGITQSNEKILFFDEFDYLSKAAQATLRRPIEEAIKRCKVIATCNYKDMIITPLLSRFTHIPFRAINHESITGLIKRVIENEDITVKGNLDELCQKVCTYGKGEIRYILNNFMEIARVKKEFSDASINFTISQNTTFASALFSGNVNRAISEGITHPRNSLSSAVTYVINSKNLKLSQSSRIKLAEMFSDGLRDITNGMPYSTVITVVSHKIHNLMTKPKKKSTVKAKPSKKTTKRKS